MPLSSSLLIAVVSKIIFGFDDILSVWTSSGAGSTNSRRGKRAWSPGSALHRSLTHKVKSGTSARKKLRSTSA